MNDLHGSTDLPDLTELLTDAVADVDPEHRLAAIRARTSARRRYHRRWYVGGGVLVAAAAAVVAVNMVDGAPSTAPRGTAPFAGTHPTPPPTTLPTHDSLDPSTISTVFYEGSTPTGRRLFAYGVTTPGAGPEDRYVALMQVPGDPHLSTAWHAGMITDVRADDVGFDVTVTSAAPVHDELAVQQLAYTLGGTIHFVGAATSSVPKAAPTAVLAPVSVIDPLDEDRVERHFTARGLTTAFEGGLTWQVLDAQGKRLAGGPVNTDGSSWTAQVDLSAVPAGEYTFEVSTGVSASGKDGVPPSTDTRTIIVK